MFFIKLFYLSVFVFIINVTKVQSAKILCLYPTPSRSQVIVAHALMKGLAEKGHEVTIVSSFPLDKPIKNYRDIYVDTYDSTSDYKVADLIATFIAGDAKSHNFFLHLPKLMKIGMHVSHIAINTPQFKKLMDEETFDLVIIGFFMNEYLLGVGAHFKAPIIFLSTVQPIGIMNDLVANPSAVSTVSHLFLGYKDHMTFFQRVKNLIASIIERFVGIYMNMKYLEYYSKNFPSDKYPSLNEMRKNVSLVLVNHHFTQGNPRPYLPSMIEVGGIQIKAKPDPLPEDIQHFLDNSENGVIFFSLGSNMRSMDIPKKKLDAIIQTFSKLKQNILWKFETDLPGLPKNVKISKWLPQDDILAHRNVKLFISHGGASSIMESKYHKKPILGIALFGDQHTNLDVIEQEGWAILLPFSELTEERLSSAILEILQNPKYTETVSYLSTLYRDRPETALNTAIFWVEYVIRHKGGKHMQSSGVFLNFFQFHSIDSWAFILITIFILIKLSSITFKCIFRKLFKSKNVVVKKKTVNNKNKKNK